MDNEYKLLLVVSIFSPTLSSVFKQAKPSLWRRVQPL